MSSWDPGWPGMSRPEISSPEEAHGTPWTVPSQHTWEIERLGPGRCVRSMVHLRQWARQVPGHLSGLNLGKAPDAQPTSACALAEHPRTRVLRLGKCTKRRAHWDSALAEHPGAWAVWTWEVHAAPALWQTQCGPSTARTPHTGPWCASVTSLPLHSTA